MHEAHGIGVNQLDRQPQRDLARCVLDRLEQRPDMVHERSAQDMNETWRRNNVRLISRHCRTPCASPCRLS